MRADTSHLSGGFAMKEAQAAESGEDRLIARYFKPLATHPGAFGLLDDAAAIAPPPGLRPRAQDRRHRRRHAFLPR